MNKEEEASGAVGGQGPSTQNPQTNMQVAPVYPIQQQSGGQMFYVMSVPPRSGEVKYATKQALVLGALQVAIGLLAIILQIALICLRDYLSYFGTGIWCGLFFILTGSIGIGSSKTKSSCLIISFMVLNILAASIFVWSWLSLSATGVSLTARYYPYTLFDPRALLALHAVMLILSLVELVITIWSAILCCAAVCCKGHSHPGMVINPANGGQVLYTMPQGPQIMTTGGQVQYCTTTQQTMPGVTIQTQNQTQQYSHYDSVQNPLYNASNSMVDPPPYVATPAQAPPPGYEPNNQLPTNK